MKWIWDGGPTKTATGMEVISCDLPEPWIYQYSSFKNESLLLSVNMWGFIHSQMLM